MTTQYKNIQVNKNLLTNKRGDVVSIAVDDDGVPLSKFWRDRLKDAEIDHCVTMLDEKEPTVKKTKP